MFWCNVSCPDTNTRSKITFFRPKAAEKEEKEQEDI